MKDYLPELRITYTDSEICESASGETSAMIRFQLIIGQCHTGTGDQLRLYVRIYSDNEEYVPWEQVTPNPTGEAQAMWLSYKGLPTGTGLWVEFRLEDNEGRVKNYSNRVSTVFAPMQIDDITWNDERTQFQIPVYSPNNSDDGEGFAYASYDRFLTGEELRRWGGDVPIINRVNLSRWSSPPNQGTLTNGTQGIDASEGQRIYVTAGFLTWGMEGEYIVPESVSYRSFPVQKPILGLVNPGCSETQKIIDIVERKPDGTLTPKGIGGKRVAIVEPCDGPVEYGAIHYKDDAGYRQVYYCESVNDFNNLANSSYGDAVISFNGVTMNKSQVLGVVIGSEIETMIDYTLNGYTNLLAIQFSAGSKLKTIASNVLCNCSKFTGRIDLPEGLQTIGERFGVQLGGITGLTVPNTVTTIGSQFLNQSIDDKMQEPIVFPASITSIGSQFLCYEHGFNQPVTLPPSITDIPQQSLQLGNTFNSQIIFPSNLQTIGDSFMSDSTVFNQPINLPNTLRYIGNYFMNNLNQFNSPISLGNSLEYIGEQFMANARVFSQDLTIPASVTSIGVSFMTQCPEMKGTLTIAGDTLPPVRPRASYIPSDYTLTTQITSSSSGFVGPESDGVHLAGPGAWRWKLMLPDRYNIYSNPGDWMWVRRMIYDGTYPDDMPYIFLNTNGYWQEINTATEAEDFILNGWDSWGDVKNVLQVIFTPRVETLTSITRIPEYFLRLARNLEVIGGLEHFKYIQSIGYGFLQSSSNSYLSFSDGKWVLPDTLTTIDNCFMTSSSTGAAGFELVLPDSLTYIGSEFLYSSRYNAPLNIPNSVTYIGDHLLAYDTVFNSPITFPNNSQCVGQYYDSQATYILYGASRFNQPITIPEKWGFVPDFFMGCTPDNYSWFEIFNQKITIPEGIWRIGNYCFNTMMQYNQPITLPSTCWMIGASFLYNCWEFTGPLKVNAPWVSIEDTTYTLATNYCSNKEAAIGVTVSGGGAESVSSQLPNISTDDGYPACRKLNVILPTGSSGEPTITGTYDYDSGNFDITVTFTPTGSVAEDTWIKYNGMTDTAMEGSTLEKNEDGSWTAHLVGKNVWDETGWKPTGDERATLASISPISSSCNLYLTCGIQSNVVYWEYTTVGQPGITSGETTL